MAILQANALDALKTLLPPGQVFTDRTALLSYESDAGLDKGRPEAVVFPRTGEEVARIVRWAAEHHIPLIARGAGTGISGGAVPDLGGVIVAFSQMNRVLEIDAAGRSALAQPAVINLVLDEQAKTRGYYFPPDPASQRASTIGGNVAENSGGPHCFKYGVTTNYVTGLEAVLSGGQPIRVGGRALDYPAYDLCGLLTGSEGTLAIITSIAVRLVRNPPGVKTLLAVFDSVEQASVAVSAVIAAGLVPAAMEMVDQKVIKIIEAYAHAGLPEDAGAIIIVEVDGYPESLDTQIQEVARWLQAHGGRDLRIAQTEEERAKIWLARKSAAGAVARLAPAYYTVDITVPRSKLAEMLTAVNEICERYDLQTGHVFHAGDGNLHPLILIPDPGNPALIERIHRASAEMITRCVAMQGSLTGEHGVGIEKREYMPIMHTSAELMAMWDIKQVFDPGNLLNPGKIFPPSADASIPFAGYMETPAPDTAAALPAISGNVWTPATAEEAARGLAALLAAGRPVSIGGAKSAQPAQGEHILLSTAALSGFKAYAPNDLYITVDAGMPLETVQRFLAAEQKSLPLAAPNPEATIGGLVAANVNAPLRMRYGAVRDLVLCATVALPDGRLIRTGRPIVKNVAGYDLTKAFIGSYGTLGLLTDVTLKVLPQPRARRTLLLPVDDLSAGLRWAEQVLLSALVASAIVLCRGARQRGIPNSPYLLAYTAEGIPEDVEAELGQVRQALRAAGAPDVLETEAISGTDLWVAMTGGSAERTLQARIGVPAKDLPAYLESQIALLEQGPFIADIAAGIVSSVAPAGADADQDKARAWVEALRRPALALDGYAVVTTLPEPLQQAIDRWGYHADGYQIMKALKARLDPNWLLNPGAFIF
ncbi:MAG TPA: FAD-linked oxidase C-terminal domain-containing protein [Ktedonobacterales bacterium]